MYCTPIQLADARLARELAEVATPERFAVVSDALMDASLRGLDRSAYDPAKVEVADLAMAVVNTAMEAADGVIDGYLAMRKPSPYPVPLNPVPRIVSVWARWIARYLLHKDRINTQESTDPIVRDYKMAIDFLEQTRDGSFSLGAGDPLPQASGGSPAWVESPREFTMGSLKDYGK